MKLTVLLHSILYLFSYAQPRLVLYNVTLEHETPGWEIVKQTPRRLYLARGGNSLDVMIPSTLTKVSEQGCNGLASNAGPFDRNGRPVGLTVKDGVVLFQGSGVGFGKTNSNQWVIGEADEAAEKDLDIFITGFDWLVYEGENVAMLHNNTTGAERASRTAIGVDERGRLRIMVADGCEKCLRNKGPTLSSFADDLITLGDFYHAVNMDGGSSSVLIDHTHVINKPKCLDLPFTCERRVASAFCIVSNSVDSHI